MGTEKKIWLGKKCKMSSKITGSYSAWCAVGCAGKKVQDEFQDYRVLQRLVRCRVR